MAVRDRRKPEFNMWVSDDGDGLVRSVWNGTKMAVGVVVAGAALGLGINAFNATKNAS